MVDHRVMVTPFTAERTLTKDSVPVNVDAVLFWVVWDAEKAGYRARIRNHGHSCFLCEIVIRSQFHTTYEPEA
jgi:hypothetical protein